MRGVGGSVGEVEYQVRRRPLELQGRDFCLKMAILAVEGGDGYDTLAVRSLRWGCA